MVKTEKKEQKKQPFCYWQYEGRGDVGETTYTCAAHVAESRAFICPYKKSEIYQDSFSGRLSIAHKTPEGNLIAVCEDFAPSVF